MVKKLDAIKMYEIAESGITATKQNHSGISSITPATLLAFFQSGADSPPSWSGKGHQALPGFPTNNGLNIPYLHCPTKCTCWMKESGRAEGRSLRIVDGQMYVSWSVGSLVNILPPNSIGDKIYRLSKDNLAALLDMQENTRSATQPLKFP